MSAHVEHPRRDTELSNASVDLLIYQREYALSAHAVVDEQADSDQVLSDMSAVLARFNIHHMTVQLERDSRRAHEPEHF